MPCCATTVCLWGRRITSGRIEEKPQARAGGQRLTRQAACLVLVAQFVYDSST